MTGPYAKTDRTTFRRIPDRGSHDRAVVEAILDEALVAHVAFMHEGVPCVIPTAFVRIGDAISIHGSSKSRMIESIVAQGRVSVCATLLDGYVLAKSAFHHSLNYRSAIVFGTATLVEEEAEKNEILRRFTDKVVPGRWDEVRAPHAGELRATSVARIAIEEASAKTRSGPPKDDPEDRSLPVWSGVVPILHRLGDPLSDSKESTPSESLRAWLKTTA